MKKTPKKDRYLRKIIINLYSIYRRFLSIGNYKIEYYGGASTPIICAGSSGSCPADGVDYISQTNRKNQVWHSHPFGAKPMLFTRDDLDWLSPSDILFFLYARHAYTFLFTDKGVYYFDIPKELKYIEIKVLVETLMDKAVRAPKNKNKKIIKFPVTNKIFCSRIGIKRSLIITRKSAEGFIDEDNDA